MYLDEADGEQNRRYP